MVLFAIWHAGLVHYTETTMAAHIMISSQVVAFLITVPYPFVFAKYYRIAEDKWLGTAASSTNSQHFSIHSNKKLHKRPTF